LIFNVSKSLILISSFTMITSSSTVFPLTGGAFFLSGTASITSLFHSSSLGSSI